MNKKFYTRTKKGEEFEVIFTETQSIIFRGMNETKNSIVFLSSSDANTYFNQVIVLKDEHEREYYLS